MFICVNIKIWKHEFCFEVFAHMISSNLITPFTGLGDAYVSVSRISETFCGCCAFWRVVGPSNLLSVVLLEG